jgi:hypothetical protein
MLDPEEYFSRMLWAKYATYKAHFHSGKFSAERKFCKVRDWPTQIFCPKKKFEVENFQLLTIFS